MKERIEKIKAHLYKHRVAYSCGATAIVVAGITYIIMRGRYEALGNAGAYGSKTADTSITMRPLSFLSGVSNQNNIVNVLAREGRGHPGYIVHCLDNGEYFFSQREAAAMLGISENLLSKHLSGKLADAEGLHFERLMLDA